MTKYLVTGGCGFIGTALIKAIVAKSSTNRIRIIDNLSVGKKDDLATCLEYKSVRNLDSLTWNENVFVEGDIRNRDLLSELMCSVDTVIHLAGNTGVAPSILDPLADASANIMGTLNVLECCRDNKVKKMIMASSGAPLGGQLPPIHEELAPKPISPYGASKLACEGYCSAYFHSFNIETISLRFSNVYGPGSKNKNSVVAKYIKKILDNEKLEIYGDGLQTRDYIYVDDLVSAIIAVADCEGLGGELFQLASGIETSIVELISILKSNCLHQGVNFPGTVFTDTMKGDSQRNYSCIDKAKSKLAWSPETDLEQGIIATFEYFRNIKNGKCDEHINIRG